MRAILVILTISVTLFAQFCLAERTKDLKELPLVQEQVFIDWNIYQSLNQKSKDRLDDVLGENNILVQIEGPFPDDFPGSDELTLYDFVDGNVRCTVTNNGGIECERISNGKLPQSNGSIVHSFYASMPSLERATFVNQFGYTSISRVIHNEKVCYATELWGSDPVAGSLACVE